jgi:hypothetical protein
VVVVEEQKPRRGARAVEAEVASVVPPDPRVGLVDAVRGDEEDLRHAGLRSLDSHVRLPAARTARALRIAVNAASAARVDD